MQMAQSYCMQMVQSYSQQSHSDQLAYKISGGGTNAHIHTRYNYSLLTS